MVLFESQAPFDRALAWLDERTPFAMEGRARADEWGIAGTSVWVLLREHLSPMRAVSDEDRASAGACLQDLLRAASSPTGGRALPGDPGGRALTSLALQALRAVRTKPEHDLRVLDEFPDARSTEAWLGTLDWTESAGAAEAAASTLLCLIHEAEVEGRHDAFVTVHRILDGLEGLQDPKTGLFGVKGGSYPWDSIVATDWLIPIFRYVRRPVQRMARIIDAILSLDQSDDALARTRGTAREALAAIRVLALVGRDSSHKSAEADAILLRSHAAIVETQRADGSFPESGSSGALQATWLRVLALTVIEETSGVAAGQRRWRFQDWPGLGYHSPGNELTAHERFTLPLWIRGTRAPGVPSIEPGTTPAVSVVVPCFNLGLYLHEAIESVLAQSSHDFEVIIVDDGSTDEYTRLLLEHFDRPRTRVIHQDNCGLAVARNEGIRQSSGRYICCLDPDDRLRPGFLARAVTCLDADPAIGLVTGHFETFDELEGAFRFESCEFPGLLVHNRAIEPSIFRREGWLRVGGYSSTFSAPGIEDWDLWIRLVELGYRAEVIPETVWDYRVRSDQMSTGMYRPDTWARLFRELVDRHADAYREHMVAVMSMQAERWAELRRWSNELMAATGWWERQAGNWERLARQGEALRLEQQARIAALEHARDAHQRETGNAT